MKKIAIFFLLLGPLVVGAQKRESTPVNIPMKNGLIWYSQTFASAGVSQDSLYTHALQWFRSNFPKKGDLTIADASTGHLHGTGSFKVTTSDNGNYYWLKFQVDIVAKPDSFTVQCYEYYEKPVEKGVSNEYSKIGYRWWDYRQGKPWSTEDFRLFTGLDENTKGLMNKLQVQVFGIAYILEHRSNVKQGSIVEL